MAERTPGWVLGITMAGATILGVALVRHESQKIYLDDLPPTTRKLIDFKSVALPKEEELNLKTNQKGKV